MIFTCCTPHQSEYAHQAYQIAQHNARDRWFVAVYDYAIFCMKISSFFMLATPDSQRLS